MKQRAKQVRIGKRNKMAKRLKRQGRIRRHAAGPATATTVSANVRKLIGRHVAAVTKRINANPHKIAAAEITASFGADAAALAGYLAAGKALGTVPVAPAPATPTAQVQPAPTPPEPVAPATPVAPAAPVDATAK